MGWRRQMPSKSTAQSFWVREKVSSLEDLFMYLFFQISIQYLYILLIDQHFWSLSW